jgi:hypothetical protein
MAELHLMVRKAERAPATRGHAFRAADSINSSDNSKLLYGAASKGDSSAFKLRGHTAVPTEE